MNIKVRLIVMNFLQFAVWGAYLTSMGTYLARVGLGNYIGLFYAMQGIVSLFMPAILGIIADRWIPAQRLLGVSHLLAALFMAGAGYYGLTAGNDVSLTVLFAFYSMSVAFYMPTLALSNSVAYTALDKAGLDTIKSFPPAVATRCIEPFATKKPSGVIPKTLFLFTFPPYTPRTEGKAAG